MGRPRAERASGRAPAMEPTATSPSQEPVIVMELRSLLERVREGVLADAQRALEAARLHHYIASTPEENAERLRALYQVLEASVASRAVLPMVRHAERIARERHQCGFDLAEVQTAFNVLEEALWRQITAQLPPADYPEADGLTSTILGAGKQSLALQYVALARSTGAPAVDIAALFAGV